MEVERNKFEAREEELQESVKEKKEVKDALTGLCAKLQEKTEWEDEMRQ